MSRHANHLALARRDLLAERSTLVASRVFDPHGYYQEEREKTLAAAREALHRAGTLLNAEAHAGDLAETLVWCARGKRCSLIAIGTRGVGSVVNLLLGSVASESSA
jgi:nucleotide-binding universal stress UspA family protein